MTHVTIIGVSSSGASTVPTAYRLRSTDHHFRAVSGREPDSAGTLAGHAALWAATAHAAKEIDDRVDGDAIASFNA